MTKAQMIAELTDVGLLLNNVNVENEKNLNNLLCAIQKVRRIKCSIEEEADENCNQQGNGV